MSTGISWLENLQGGTRLQRYRSYRVSRISSDPVRMTIVRKNFQDRVRGLAAVGRCCWPREYERGVVVVLRKDWEDWNKIGTICATTH